MPARCRSFAWRRIAFVTLCVFAAAPALGDAVTVRDAAGRGVAITDTSRIISIGGAVTEILYALGLERRVIAVDTTSLYPPRALAEKPNVGYMRQLSAEGVLGLGPSLVLAGEGAGPKETIAVLDAARVPFVRVPEVFTGEGIIDKVRLIAKATGTSERGECLVKRVQEDLDVMANLRRRIEQPRKVMFLMSFLNGRPMVAGRTTAAEGIIELAGGRNAVDKYEGYKLINDESVIAAQPDAVLAMERPSFRLDADTVFAHAAFATTPAADHKAFVSMDGLYLLGFGPRAARAARDLAAALYPTLSGPPLPSERTPLSDACQK
jgi:iron complex transport system substrate-binding protein